MLLFNFNVLQSYRIQEDGNNPKKVRFDLPFDNHDKFQSKIESKKDDKLGSADDFEDGDMGDIYENTWYAENMDQPYFPEDDGYNYDDHY